jgi:3-methyladenine DNA glycosylase AlkD
LLLRQIGKRNTALNCLAIQTAKEIHAMESKTARWIATDALRELTGEKIKKRLRYTQGL